MSRKFMSRIFSVPANSRALFHDSPRLPQAAGSANSSVSYERIKSSLLAVTVANDVPRGTESGQ